MQSLSYSLVVSPKENINYKVRRLSSETISFDIATENFYPDVCFFFSREEDLINFKNNIIFAYEQYERGKK